MSLDPTIGSEIKKTRPAVVVSNDQNNKYSPLITVLPITSNVETIYPWEVFLKSGDGGLKEKGKIKTNQIRTVDKRRLSGPPLGPPLSPNTMDLLSSALKIHLSID